MVACVVVASVAALLLLVLASANDNETAAAAEYSPPGLRATSGGPPEPPPVGPYGNPPGTIPAEPAEFVMRPRLPLCGAERPEGLSARRDLAARRCLVRAWRKDTPAELVSVSPTPEGPFLVIYRVIGDGTVEALSNDAPYGQGPIRKICRKLRVSLRRPSPASGLPLSPTGIRASRCERAETWG